MPVNLRIYYANRPSCGSSPMQNMHMQIVVKSFSSHQTSERRKTCNLCDFEKQAH